MSHEPEKPPAESKSHWEEVYNTRAPEAVSWYAPHLMTSLAYLKRTGMPHTAAIVDIGGGESTLVDDLLDDGYLDVSVLDLSAKALEVARARLGARAAAVKWHEADVLTHAFEPESVDIWHDRAVFHFLTHELDKQRYVSKVLNALRPGGYAIVGTFGPAGPTQCSGLPVARYAPDDLHDEFGSRFRLIESRVDLHTTPWGSQQQFVYCFCRLE
ncbi:MAG TPA: class I SAM-dependent methyltransferase [Rhizobacter sp.]|jgi:SAM-dependent methyltransferase